MPQACVRHSASVLGGLVYIVEAGGSGREVLRFDPVLEAWSTLAPTSDSRRCGASFVLGDCLYAVGGLVHRSSVELYYGTSNTWTAAVADLLEGRRHFGVVTMGTAGPSEEQDLFDVLIANAGRGAL
jgi:predicted P-loop ATPase/GTPase